MKLPMFLRKCTNCASCVQYKGTMELTKEKKVVYHGKANVCTKGNFEMNDTKACEVWEGSAKVSEVEGTSPFFAAKVASK